MIDPQFFVHFSRHISTHALIPPLEMGVIPRNEGSPILLRSTPFYDLEKHCSEIDCLAIGSRVSTGFGSLSKGNEMRHPAPARRFVQEA